MSLSDKAAANILRLLNTEDERNSLLAIRLLDSQQAADDFLLSLCGHFMVARGEERLVLRNCLRALLLILARDRGASTREKDRLMWLLNYDPEQKDAHPGQFLLSLEQALKLDILVLARFLFSQKGLCAPILFQRGKAEDKKAMLKARQYEGPFGHTLDLSQLELTELPEEARPLANLQALDLSDNRLKAFDIFFFRPAQQIRRINLSNNQLTTVPEGLNLLPHLREIDLRDNPLRLSLFDYLRHPLKDKLKVNLRMEKGFSLSHFNEKDVACILKNWIYDTGGRQMLDLYGRGIRPIPTAIRDFPGLAIIDLRKNPIGSLPLWLLKLPGLSEIYCSQGVEYNSGFLTEGLVVWREAEKSPPTPHKPPPPWLSRTTHFPGSLPLSLSVESLPVR